MGDSLDGHIVMRRAHAARRKNEVESVSKAGYLLADELDDVGNRGDFLYFDSEPAQLGAEKIGIGILGFSRQDFVPDDYNASALRRGSFSSNAIRRLMPPQGDAIFLG